MSLTGSMFRDMTSPISDLAISARGLRKTYGDVVALDGLDLDVAHGQVVGLLGPNGAGKTTAVSILTTLTEPDAGTASVAGVDLGSDPQELRRRIGLSGQYAAVDEVLTGRENLAMIGRLYRMPKAVAKARAAELLERFSLTEAGDRPVKGYSGGMRRRLDLAGALVAEPPVLFLDEPTTGLDPRSRQDLWEVIRKLVSEGATLLLTTQYLEEADQLADEIIVIDKGKAIAHGTADELKERVGGARAEVLVADDRSLEPARAVLGRYAAAGDDVEVRNSSRRLLVAIEGGAPTLARIIDEFAEHDIAVSDIGLRRPTLDDVFLTLTGEHTDTSAHDDTNDSSIDAEATS